MECFPITELDVHSGAKCTHTVYIIVECIKFFGSVMQGRGNKSSGDNFHAAPNIDHSQDFVRKDLKEWLCWLRLSISFFF